MSEKQSEARRKYWASRTQEERSAHARHAITIRHSRMSEEEKKLLVQKLNKARLC